MLSAVYQFYAFDAIVMCLSCFCDVDRIKWTKVSPVLETSESLLKASSYRGM
jgi:hypothetical protein